MTTPGGTPGGASAAPDGDGASAGEASGALSQIPHFEPGTMLLGQFEVLEILGRGGPAAVYQARHLPLGREIALKAVASVGQALAVGRVLLGEYQAQRAIKDMTHVLRAGPPLMAQAQNLDWVLLPMELGEKSLREWLGEVDREEEGWLEEGLELLGQVCRGVEAIHGAGLVHLDLKPENVLLVGEGRGKKKRWTAKVADFGLSRGLAKLEEARPELFGDGVGTPAYMAPEQVLAAHWKDVGPAADVYALGMMLFELLDGDLPYSGSGASIKAKKRGERLKIRRPGGPERLVDLALRCLSREEGQRPATAGEVGRLLVEDPEERKAWESAERQELREAERKASRWREVAVGEIEAEMVWVRAGTFMMGSGSGLSNEKPGHRVRITRDFLLGKTPVTQEQWEAVMGSNPSQFKGDSRRPVENVSWEDAREFIGKLNGLVKGGGFRLPTEAEWEYACRAGRTGKYGGTGRLEDMGWYSDNSGGETHSVGQKRANAWGLFDMHGNVWEWCQDWYDGSYYARSPEADPRGPSSGSFRVLRGGSWYGLAINARCAFRNNYYPSYRDSSYGFRLARTL